MKIIASGALLLMAVPGCGFGKSMDIPLAPVGNSAISGTVQLTNSFCKSRCVSTQFHLTGGGSLRGAVRWGSCSAPGELLGGSLSTDPTFSEPISHVGSLDELSGKACVQVLHETSSLVLACGNIP